jgi:hypothetical protein
MSWCISFRRRRAPAKPADIGKSESGRRRKIQLVFERSFYFARNQIRHAAGSGNTPRMRPSLETIVAPSGCSGVHFTPKAGHSCGLIGLAKPGRSGTRRIPRRDDAPRRIFSRRRTRRIHRPTQAALRNFTDAAPFAGNDFENFLDQILRRLVAFAAHGAAVLVFHFGAAGFKLLHRHQHALQNVQRLEAGDDNRHAVFFRDGKYSSNPITVQTWPAARNPCTRQFGDDINASMAGGTSTCEMSIEKFRRFFCAA